MRRVCRVLAFLFALAPGTLSAQVQPPDYASQYLTPDFTYDAARSQAAQKSVQLVTSVLTGSPLETQGRVWVFRYSGSIEQAFEAITIPDTAKVQKPHETDHAASLGLLPRLLADQARTTFGQAWLDRAKARADELGSVKATRFIIFPEGDLETLADAAPPGRTVRLVVIDGMSPMLEYETLEIVPGTWARLMEITFTVPAGTAAGRESAEAAGPTAADLGVSPPPGALWLDPDDVSPMDELQGDHNFLVRAPLRQVVDALVASRERHCRVESEGAMFGPDETEIPVISVQCLTHQGEPRTGDDVVAVTLSVPSEDLLLEAAPSTQGSWTLVMFSRWTEEQ